MQKREEEEEEEEDEREAEGRKEGRKERREGRRALLSGAHLFHRDDDSMAGRRFANVHHRPLFPTCDESLLFASPVLLTAKMKTVATTRRR